MLRDGRRQHGAIATLSVALMGSTQQPRRPKASEVWEDVWLAEKCSKGGQAYEV